MLSPDVYRAGMTELALEYSFTLTDEILSLRWRGLCHLTDNQFKYAVCESMKTCKIMPRINELLRIVEARKTELAVEAAKLAKQQTFHIAQEMSKEEREKSEQQAQEAMKIARGLFNGA